VPRDIRILIPKAFDTFSGRRGMLQRVFYCGAVVACWVSCSAGGQEKKPNAKAQVVPAARASADKAVLNDYVIRLLRAGSQSDGGTQAGRWLYHTVRKVSGQDEECPIHPEVDTMEFRPSDARPGEFRPKVW
jgi:hypothetical protein